MSNLISGNVGVVGATVLLAGTSADSTVSDGASNFSFTVAGDGTYSIVPSLSGFLFTPDESTVTVAGADVTGVNFVAAANAAALVVDSRTTIPVNSDAVSEKDSREAGIIVDSRVAAYIPVDSRTKN